MTAAVPPRFSRVPRVSARAMSVGGERRELTPRRGNGFRTPLCLSGTTFTCAGGNRALLSAVAVAVLWTAGIDDLRAQPAADLLLVGGLVHDGSGQPPVRQDVGVTGGRISFVGDAEAAGLDAAVVVDVDGLMVTPGFIDMHSHAELTEDYGRGALAFLHQGITTVAIGVDGGGTPDVAELFARLEGRIGVNAFAYAGHGEIRRRVIGEDDRAPTPAELGEMRALVRRAMDEGAFGLSTGLFYVPGYYATTEEVIELARVAAAFDGIYDTHDRDLGASYRGVGYLESIREGIRIAESAGLRGIFSHFNAQGAQNYGRAPEGARLIEEARARGVEVSAAQHVYTATQSSLAAYAIPRWASNGGRDEMLERFRDPETVRRLDVETMEMLAIRGGRREAPVRRPPARAERPDPRRRGGRVGAGGTRGGAAHPRRRQRGGDEPRSLRHREHALPGAATVDDDLHRRPHAGSRAERHPPPRLRGLHAQAPPVRARRAGHRDAVRPSAA